MRVLLINSVCGIGSTGRICTDISDELKNQGHEVRIAFGRGQVPEKYKDIAVRIGCDRDVKINALKCRLFDNEGFSAKAQTKRFLRWAEEYDPDLVWLHNLHGYYLNVGMLFSWIKSRPQMKVKWTLHDCWAFTGHCSNFFVSKCTKWKTGCEHCPQKKRYPQSAFYDGSARNYSLKKKAFCGVSEMEIITPSQWLAGLVKESFLKEYPIAVVHNTVDTTVFKPTEKNFKKRDDLKNKIMILGVSGVWTTEKGYRDFLKLADRLDERFAVVLVGLTKKQMETLPKNVIGVERTNSKEELADIYSSADLFVNLTYSDNFPTVNLEARACGTPIVTYNTGGSPESAGEEAEVVPTGDLDAVFELIQKRFSDF